MNKTNTHKQSNTHDTNGQNQTQDRPDQELERVAEELDSLARKFLPDRAMQDRYCGVEADMRQDAILLALKWYLRNRVRPDSEKEPWNATKFLGGAIKIMRRDYAKAQKSESDVLEALPEEYYRGCHHPSLDKASDWSRAQMEIMVYTAIRKLLGTGKITQANAAVTLALLVDGIRAADIAKRLGVHRSTICHHFFRVRRFLPDVLDGIEVPRAEIF